MRGKFRIWHVYPAAVAVFLVLYVLAVPRRFQGPAYIGFVVVALSLQVTGLVRNRPVRSAGLWLLAVGVAFEVAGESLLYGREIVLGAAAPFPSVADAAFLSGYPFMVAGLALVVRASKPGHSFAGWIDSLLTAGASALVVFLVAVHPAFAHSSAPLSTRLVATAYPVADILLVAVLARLIVTQWGRSTSFVLLISGSVTYLVSDLFYSSLAPSGTYATGLVDVGWLLGYASFAAAMLHPSVNELTRPLERREMNVGPFRIVMPALAAFVAPGLYFAYPHVHTEPFEVAVLAAGASVLFALVIARFVVVVRELAQARRELEGAAAVRTLFLHRTLRVAEGERERVATLLHDRGIGFTTSLSYRLEGLRARLAAAGRAEAYELADLARAVQTETGYIRAVMNELRPGSLVERGLPEALHDLCSATGRESSVAFAVDAQLLERPPAEIEVVLYRIGQEAIVNALAHAAPHRIEVTVRHGGGGIELAVSDDGSGFDPSSDGGPSLGLATMREYAEMAGGTLDVRSARGKGTTVVATVPSGGVALSETA